MEGTMWFRSIAFAAAVLAIILTAVTPAAAMPPDGVTPKRAAKANSSPNVCASYSAHAAYLAKQYGEAPVFTGTVGSKFIFRVFTNRSTGTWTMLVVHANGISCVKASGRNGRPEHGL